MIGMARREERVGEEWILEGLRSVRGRERGRRKADQLASRESPALRVSPKAKGMANHRTLDAQPLSSTQNRDITEARGGRVGRDRC